MSIWMAPGGCASNRDLPASLSEVEERRLFHLLWYRPRSSRAAQSARTRLIIANPSLVVPIAENLVTRRGSLPDLIQEGNFALVRQWIATTPQPGIGLPRLRVGG